MNKETLKRAAQLTKELREITEDKDLENKLAIYSMSQHPALCNIDDIKIGNNYIGFLASGHARGYFEESFGVTWDFLDDPEAYILKEKQEKEKQEQKEEEERKKKFEERERQKLKELKEKYES